jgi:hypothetical protein
MQQQQQQHAMLAGNTASPGFMQLGQLADASHHNMSHNITEDLYDQLLLLAAQRASSPSDGMQQQVQMSSQGTPLQQWQLPLLQGAMQLPLPLQQQQQQQAAAGWSLDTESSSRRLLQQRQGLAAQNSPLQQQQQQPAAAAFSAAAPATAAATNNVGMQPLALLVPMQSGPAALSGAQTLLPIAVTADGSTATLMPQAVPAMNSISSATVMQAPAQLLNLNGSSSSNSNVPTLQYVTLLDGQRVLLPVTTPGHHVTANVTLSQPGVTPGLSACYMSPQQQQQQLQPIMLMQQQGSACAPLAAGMHAASSSSSSISSAAGLTAVPRMAYTAPNQQQQGVQQVPQVTSSSSILLSPPGVSLPMMQLQQGEVATMPSTAAAAAAAATWQQQQQQYIQCSESQMLVNLMQHCSISQQVNEQWA